MSIKFWSYLDIVLKLTFAENEWQVAFIKFSFRIVADDFNIDIGSILLRVYRQNYKSEWLGMLCNILVRMLHACIVQRVFFFIHFAHKNIKNPQKQIWRNFSSAKTARSTQKQKRFIWAFWLLSGIQTNVIIQMSKPSVSRYLYVTERFILVGLQSIMPFRIWTNKWQVVTYRFLKDNEKVCLR